MSNLNDTSRIKEAALQYVKMKLPIIPICPASHKGMSFSHRERCQYPGKMPVIKDWTAVRTTSIEDIESWFQSNPYYNIGLVLGETDDWNIVGVDVDGPTGERVLVEWSQGVLPITWEFTTSKGRRYLYKLPDGLKSKKKKEAQDKESGELALIATGQQTIFPPSVHHSGAQYAWVEGRDPLTIPIAEAPAWIINRVIQWEAPGTNEFNDLSHFTDEVLSAPVTQDDWNKNVGTGERNNHLTKLVGSLIARRNIPKEDVVSFAHTWNLNHCQPPLPLEEVQSMVETIFASEEMKHAKRSKLAASKNSLQPVLAAQQFIQEQSAQGVSWKYSAHRAAFYRCDDYAGPWTEINDLFVNQAVRPFLIAQDPTWCNMKHVNEVIHALREELADQDLDYVFDIGATPKLDQICIEDGMFDWKTGEITPWDSKSYSTIKLPVNWDPRAPHSAEYELWEKTLAEWLPEKEARMYLQEYIGYCLIPDCGMRTATLLYGGGKNGKSLFIDVISPMFGNYVNHTSLSRMSERFEPVNLVNKLVNICADIDDTYLNETGLLKSIIAGDKIRGERKFGASFDFKPVCRLLFSANTLPKSSDKSEGWYSRWRFVHFPKQFQVDSNYKITLLEKLGSQAGINALFYWAVEGLRRVKGNNAFTTSRMIEESAKQYKAENDSVVGFIESAIEKVPHAGKETQLASAPLHKVYKSWCEAMGCKPVSQIEFTKRMCAMNIEKAVRPVQGRSTTVFLGTMLRAEIEVDINLAEQYKIELAMISSCR